MNSIVVPHDIWFRACMESPISATVDRLHESMYFYSRMLAEYHEPDPFRYNLNAFIQALRSTTEMLRAEQPLIPNGAAWFARAQKRLASNALIAKVKGVRDYVVHKGELQRRSHAYIGLYRYHKNKLTFEFPVDPFTDSKTLLEEALPVFVGSAKSAILDEAHIAIGEEIGIERDWIIDELGADDVTTYCRSAYAAVECVVRQAVALTGGLMMSHDLPTASEVKILTESDADPGAIDRWGW